MLNGKLIAEIIKNNNISLKEASGKIGISYNTLSNIVNNKVSSSPASEKKITEYFNTHFHINPSELHRKNISLINIRMKPVMQLSGNEKSILREDLSKYEKLMTFLNWTDNHLNQNDGYITEIIYDYYTLPQDDDWFTWIQRREKFFEKRNEAKIHDAYDALRFLKSNDIFELLLARNFRDISTDTGRIVITIAEALGIKILFVSLKSSKILSASTTFLDKNRFHQEAAIVINKNACKTPEKILMNIAKELYYILFEKNEYSLISDYKLEIEKDNCEGYIFAQKLLFNEESAAKILNENKNNSNLFDLSEYSELGWIYLICEEMKKSFIISYKDIIHFLFSTHFKKIDSVTTESEFITYFNNAIEKYNQGLPKPAYSFFDGELQVSTFAYSCNNLSLCIRCFLNEKDKSEENQKMYKEYKDFLETL